MVFSRWKGDPPGFPCEDEDRGAVHHPRPLVVAAARAKRRVTRVSAMRILSAAWVVPVSSPPIRGGAIAIEGDEIVAVGSREEILARFGEKAGASEAQAHPGPGIH